MNQSNEINELAKALSQAQGEITSALKENENKFFGSKYADLADVWRACRQPLSKYGLSVVQTTQKVEDEIVLYTTLLHASGQWVRSELPLELPKDDVIELDRYGKEKKRNRLQVIASAMTYTRRIALSALVGVAPDDDTDDDAESCNLPVDKQQSRTQYNKQAQQKPIDQAQYTNQTSVNYMLREKTQLANNLEFKKIDKVEFEKFVQENRLKDPANPMCIYLTQLAKKKDFTISEMLEYCFRNKDGFFKAFKDHQEERLKNLQSESVECEESKEMAQV